MQNRYDTLDKSNLLRTFFLIAFKRKKMIVSVFSAVAITGLLVTFLMPPVFQASSQIVIEREIETDKALLFNLNFQNNYQGYDWLKSEVEIINSTPVARSVMREFLQPDSSGPLPANINPAQTEAFLHNLKVRNLSNSNIIEITYRGRDAVRTAAIANSIVDTYKIYRAKIYNDSETFAFLEAQIKIADDNLRKMEQELTDYKTSEEILSPGSQGDILLNKLSEYESRLTSVTTKRISNEAKVAVIKQQLRHGLKMNIPSTDVSEGPSRRDHIAKLKGDLLDKVIEREKMLQRFNPTYPKILNLNKDIATLEAQIKIEIQQIVEQEETGLRALRAEEKALRGSISQINHEIKGFARKEFEFSQLNRGIDDNRKVYSVLLKQRAEARMSLSKLQRDVKIKIIDPAVVPLAPVMPKRALFTLISLVLAFLLALGVAFLREYFDNTIYTTDELRSNLGLKVLGAVKIYDNVGQYIK